MKFINTICPLILLCTGLLILSCEENSEEAVKIVAQVGPYHLTKDKIDQSYLAVRDGGDSSQVVQRLIEQWAYDRSFELEAMKNLDTRQELDALIDAYRSSLITHLFEKQLFEHSLDSFITAEELESYYSENKSQYVLNSSIMRLLYIDIDKNHSQMNQIRSLWNAYQRPTAMDSLIVICNSTANTFLLEDSSWYKLDELERFIPKNMLKTGSERQFQDQIFSNDTAKYFLRVLEQIPDTEIAPLSFIEKQARKVILYQRKQKLIRRKRDEIYDAALKANRINYY